MRSSATALLMTVAVAVTVNGCSRRDEPTVPKQSALPGHADRDIGMTFTPFDPPGSTLTLPTDINARGQIIGRYLAAGHTHGFLREPEGTITTIDYPGSSFTVLGSINNNGTIVGWYSVATSPTVRRGFLFEDGVFTSIDPPGSLYTNVLGINERGDVVGRFCTLALCRQVGSGDFHGFVYRDGELTILDVPGATETDPFKVVGNDAIVGGVSEGGAEHLFVYRNGEFTPFGLPNGKNVTMDNGGGNTRGDIVGTYCDAPGLCLIGPFPTHGFLLSNGELTTIDYPGARATSAVGINEQGAIVGGYIDATGQLRGYLLSR